MGSLAIGHDVRELTARDCAWFVKDEDFDGFQAVIECIDRRSAILKTADTAGIERECFPALDPDKSGFEGCVADVLCTIIKAVKHAAK